ncbi:MAG: single-stranded-DNA-specific exonuclease RecJ [Pseudomonadota bacterium]|nr:single-stranded-DNA-specific exonuclease RecJ [Pseudomonadota bacterium]
MTDHSLLPPVLGVDRSLLGQRWHQPPVDDRAVAAMARTRSLPEIVARILVRRGVALEEADSFLNPSLRACLPDPSHLKDMDAAVARLVRAVEGNESVAVFADYDVDGATSAALLARWFRAVGRPLRIYVPDRLKEGYGPNPRAMETLRTEGHSLCVTVDCGTTAFEALDAAARVGLDVIVLDHHLAGEGLPPAVAVVNPNRLDETTPLRQIAAVTVTFLMLVALNRALRQKGFFAGRAEPDLLSLLDLVAIGTVCDVMPLTGLNRALVAQGLKVLARRGNAGLAALADLGRLDQAPEAWHAGFVFGPRINAGGRVGGCDTGARLLATDDPVLAGSLARELEDSNALRKEIEHQVYAEALPQAQALVDRGDLHLVVSGQGWHPGVIGIVAGRLKERFRRPASVIAVNDQGVGKASARSVRGIDLGAAILTARRQGLLLAGGGHAMAAGFTVEADRIGALSAFLSAEIATRSSGVVSAAVAEVDGIVSPAGANADMVNALAGLGPFGAGHPEPRLAVPDMRVVRSDMVGAGHVRCMLAGPDGSRLKGIAFRCADTPLGEALLNGRGRVMHLLGQLKMDRFRGADEVQMVVEDGAFAA